MRRAHGAIDRVLRRLVQRPSPDHGCAAALGPRLCTSAGIAEVALLRVLGVSTPAWPLAAQVPVRQHGVADRHRAFVRRAHRLGLARPRVDVDDPAEMHRLLDLGVDGIMTDRPAVLRDVLLERGQWV